MTKFFGLYALSGQVTAFVAPIMVAFFTGFFESQRVGFGSILILLAAGVALMIFVKEERAEALPEEGGGSSSTPAEDPADVTRVPRTGSDAGRSSSRSASRSG